MGAREVNTSLAHLQTETEWFRESILEINNRQVMYSQSKVKDSDDEWPWECLSDIFIWNPVMFTLIYTFQDPAPWTWFCMFLNLSQTAGGPQMFYVIYIWTQLKKLLYFTSTNTFHFLLMTEELKLSIITFYALGALCFLSLIIWWEISEYLNSFTCLDV